MQVTGCLHQRNLQQAIFIQVGEQMRSQFAIFWGDIWCDLPENIHRQRLYLCRKWIFRLLIHTPAAVAIIYISRGNENNRFIARLKARLTAYRAGRPAWEQPVAGGTAALIDQLQGRVRRQLRVNLLA
jgi:hypothetical protein